MTCPTNEDWMLLSMNQLDDARAEAMREHLETCDPCRERFDEARRDHVELIRTYEALDRDHDARREQLMASLPAAGPASVSTNWPARGWRWLGEVTMNHPKTRRATGLLAAAAAIVFAMFLFVDANGGVAFAQVIERLQQVRTIVCHVSGGFTEYAAEGKLYMAHEFGTRIDFYMGDDQTYTVFSPVEGPSTLLNWQQKMYMVMRIEDYGVEEGPGRRPEAWLAQLRGMTEDPDRHLGRDVIEGRTVEGFEISGDKLGVNVPGAIAQLWVDPETRLPVRFVIFEPAAESGSDWDATYDQFQFDIPLDPALFEIVIPEDFIAFGMPEVSEATLLQGLRFYPELTDGTYPLALELTQVQSGLAGAIAATVAATGEQPDMAKPEYQVLGQKVLLITTGCAFYAELVQEGREPEYFGDSVKPGDADAVLMQWRLDDGRTRVIYGDLRTETIPTSE